MKFLIWAVIGYFVVSWFLRGQKVRKTQPGPQPGRNIAIEPIVQCAHCGLHVPASEAIHTPAGLTYCCEEHHLQIKIKEH